MKRNALISDDGQYRYWLTRVWNESLPYLAIIGVNPSTADAEIDDATIRKDIGFASRLGFGGFVKLNVAAFRARDPKVCKAAVDPIGPMNTAEFLLQQARLFGATKFIAAWGKNGIFFDRECSRIVEVFPELWCWGRNGDGTPRHPLMLPYSTPLERFC